MNCPNCGKKINAAAILGAAGKGKSKDFSKAERKRRSERMKALNAKRRTESQNVPALAQTGRRETLTKEKPPNDD